ncbi:putative hscarg dehydrogenase [Podospora didyma]|uniref:Hscarg dehydrogenase n=1 Tax=Podospora didyma TaxID=330526 RepID=A0AAE0U3T8_9PEZI|nr:putative hscarg dehydrogenase [Podospora didyma]
MSTTAAKKILVVFGATGQQGGSVVQYVLNDPELSQEFQLRVITRDTTSPKAKALVDKNVEVVQGDLTDRASIEAALTGAHTVYLMTKPDWAAPMAEYTNGKLVADVAVQKGVSYVIFSTLPSITKLSSGKYRSLGHFDEKEELELYIRSLRPTIKSAFVSPGFFTSNFHNFFLTPTRAADGVSWSIKAPVSGTTQLPLINVVEDTGKWVGAILAEPEKFEGKVFAAATALYTLDEVAAAMTKATGKKIVFEQISDEDFKKSAWPGMGVKLTEVMKSLEEFSYWGPDTQGEVDWAAANARGKLTSFEEFLEANPLPLE